MATDVETTAYTLMDPVTKSLYSPLLKEVGEIFHVTKNNSVTLELVSDAAILEFVEGLEPGSLEYRMAILRSTSHPIHISQAYGEARMPREARLIKVVDVTSIGYTKVEVAI